MSEPLHHRVSNWPAALHRFLLDKESRAFEWGLNDCCLFTCDGILAITGCDLAGDLRGTYTDAISARCTVKELGGVESIADNRCKSKGWPRIAVPFAGRGDVVCVDMAHGPTLGICTGALSAFAGKDGTIFQPTLNCRAAWRII